MAMIQKFVTNKKKQKMPLSQQLLHSNTLNHRIYKSQQQKNVKRMCKTTSLLQKKTTRHLTSPLSGNSRAQQDIPILYTKLNITLYTILHAESIIKKTMKPWRVPQNQKKIEENPEEEANKKDINLITKINQLTIIFFEIFHFLI